MRYNNTSVRALLLKLVVPGVLWLIIQSRWHERPMEAAPSRMAQPDDEVLEGRVG